MRFWTLLIARLSIAAVLIGWVLSIFFLPDSGKKELQRSLDALKKVDSFHYTMSADVSSQHTEEEADLVCSEDSFHRKTHVEKDSGENPLRFDMETLRSNDQEFRLMPNGLWRRDGSGLETPKTTCQRIAQGQQTWIIPDMGNFIQYGMIEKGDKKTIDGKRCREWKIADLSGPGALVRSAKNHVTLCLDIDDHLPREMLVAETNSRWTYDFDKPIHIDVPTPLEPEPVRNTYQPPPNPGLTLSDANAN